VSTKLGSDVTMPGIPSEPPRDMPVIPTVDLGAFLGGGAFGTVYLGHHRTLDVDVAVKLVRGNATALELALAEARFMARLDHPNLVRIHDAGRSGAAIYLVMELMDGGSLADHHAIERSRLLEIAIQLLGALQALHDARVIHRDIKPANCLVRTRDGRVKLSDLGVAAEQSSRLELAGTLAFMAPEMFDANPRIGERSDLYALGMTLACLALPSDPFPTGNVAELIAWAKSGSRPALGVERPDLPQPLTSLIERLLAANPEDRPATAGDALSSLLAEGSQVRVSSATVAASEHRVGPWRLGELAYDGPNWLAYAATHVATGSPARFSRAREGAPVLAITEQVLAAAARFSRFDHPGLLAILDWGMVDSVPYMVSAPQGRSLLQLVSPERPCDEHVALEFAADLADCLAFLHANGLVYQVVEPNAAYVTPDARHVHLGWHVYCVEAGTPLGGSDDSPRRAGIPQFMPPEAFTSTATIDPAVDIWGLGEVLYCLIAGEPATSLRPGPGAHIAKSFVSLGELAIAKQQPAVSLRERAPLVTQPTARLVGEMMSIDPAKRPSDAAGLRDELRHIAARLRGR